MRRIGYWLSCFIVAACEPVEPPDSGCTLECGEGFACVVDGFGASCAVTGEVAVELASPAGGLLVTGGDEIDLACNATAPQLSGVAFKVTPAGGAAETITGTRTGGTGPFTATYVVAAGANGAVEVECEAAFGPTGYAQTRASAKVTFTADTTSPTVEATSPTTWHRRSGTTELVATATDANGVASATLTIGAQTVTGTAKTATEWGFTIDLSTVGTATTAGELEFEVKATDRAGNEETTEGTLLVDATAPQVSWTPDTAWKRRNGTFEVNATASTEANGAPVSTIVLKNANGQTVATGAADGTNAWRFEVDGADLAAEGTEGEVAFAIEATDAAGNVGALEPATAKLKVDGKAPQLEILGASDWYARGPTASVTVRVVDEGAGVQAGTVRVAGDANCNTTGAANEYACFVATNGAPADAESQLAFTVEAADAATNPGSADGQLKIDAKKPVVTLTRVLSWAKRTDTVVLRGTASDEGSGIAAQGPTLDLTVNGTLARTLTGTYDANDGTLTFQVSAEVAPAAQTTTNIGAVARVLDARGNEGTFDLSNAFKVDAQPPTVTNVTVVYPANAIEPNKLLRRDVAGLGRDKATICATINEQGSGAGLDAASIVLGYGKTDGTPTTVAPAANTTACATAAPSATHAFVLDAADVLFSGIKPGGTPFSGDDTVGVSVRAKDLVANETAGGATVGVTRKLWDVRPGASVRIVGAPALDANNVYIAIQNGVAGANVFALNRQTGATTGDATIAGAPTTPVTLSPRGGSNRSYVASDDSGGTLYGFSTTLAAEFNCSMSGITNGALAVGNMPWPGGSSETVFAATSSSTLVATRRTASCEQKFGALGADNAGDSTVVLHGTSALFGINNARFARGVMNFSTPFLFQTMATTPTPSGATLIIPGAALLRDGTSFFTHVNFASEVPPSFTTDTRITIPAFTAKSSAPPTLVQDDVLAFGSDVGSVFVVNTTTQAVNDVRVVNGLGAGQPVQVSPAVGQTGATRTLYFGANDGRVISAATSGTYAWTHNAAAGAPGTQIVASPALSCDGTLYVGTNNGRVIALVTDSSGLANSSWPKFQHDNRNTGNVDLDIYVNGVCQD